MMSRKTDEERLKQLEERMEQLTAKKQQIKSRLKEKKRKERTCRLIQICKEFDWEKFKEKGEIVLKKE
jgi:hypothetical protein